jgi:serine/threonine-protein kinase
LPVAGSAPFFSPDGHWVGFGAVPNLNKIPVDGGPIERIGELPDPGFTGASWGDDGSIVLSYNHPGPTGLRGATVRRIPPGGGPPATLLEIASGQAFNPQILPGGKAVLFSTGPTARDDPGDANRFSVEVITLTDQRRKKILAGAAYGHYVSTGHLIYTVKGTLLAIPFDLDRLETYGHAVPILDQLGYREDSSAGSFDVSRTGALVYRGGGVVARVPPGDSTVQLIDSAGKSEVLATGPAEYVAPRLSPDGKRLLYEAFLGIAAFVYDRQREITEKITNSGTYNRPLWSTDGAYVVIGKAGTGLVWTRADGSMEPQPLIQSKNLQIPWSFSPMSKQLAYDERMGGQGGMTQIWTVPIEYSGGKLTAGTPEQFLKSQSIDQDPAFSPDGRWLAYSSDESGTSEVYVRPFPPPASGQSPRKRISNNGGRLPQWSSDGRNLLYAGSGREIMAVSYTATGDVFLPDKPRVWLAKSSGSWSIAPDGKHVVVSSRILASEQAPPPPDHEVTFVFNFLDELRRRVPLAR